MFEHDQWYTGAITDVEYIESPVKGTKGLKLTVDVSDRGAIAGIWWLTSSMVTDPDDKSRKCPQWEAAQKRCKQFGCTQDGLVHPQTWLQHIRTALHGQQASVLAEVNNYGDVSASMIGKPKASGSSKFVAAQAAASPFAARPVANSDPFAVSDDDIPY
jgi:hypothetical protein